MEPLYPILVLLLSFGRFVGAGDFDYDIEGNLYVVDGATDMLVKYSAAGDSLRAVSGTGRGESQFDAPVAVRARRGTDIYVADYNNHRIQRFDRRLDYVSTIETRDDPEEWKRFGYPRDMAVTRQGDLLIVDGENRRVLKINSFGQPERAFGGITAGRGRLVDPSRIEVSDADHAFVLDGERIVEFDPFGSYLGDITLGADVRPETISIDNDTLVVSTTSNVLLVDLSTRSMIGRWSIDSSLTAIRLLGGRLLGLDSKRMIVFGREE